MKKVCILTSVHPVFDTRIFHKEAKTLAEAGYNVTLIAQHDKEETVDGIKIIPLPKPKNRWERFLKLDYLTYKKALEQKADIYHFHDPELLPWAVKLKKKTGAKVIYDIHEDYVTSIKEKKYIPWGVRDILSWIFNYIERLYAKNLTKILAEKYYVNRFPDGKTILNYPILSKSKKENCPKINLEGTHRVIYTGNISENRGALIHASLPSLIPSVYVYMIGKHSKQLADRIRGTTSSGIGSVFVEGEEHFVPHEIISAYYNAGNWVAALAIFPPSKHYYRKELTKFFEYMEAGIPIIASNFPVWKEIIEGNHCGICVNPLEPKEIAGAIEYLIEHPEEAKKMGENGRKAVLEKYNWENESKKLLEVYEKLSK